MGFSFNPVSLISHAVESACDAILPKQLEFIGDLASMATNLHGGNVLGALDDARDFLQDFPQQLNDLTHKSGGAAAASAHSSEAATWDPGPPPPQRQGFGLDMARYLESAYNKSNSHVSDTLRGPATRGNSPPVDGSATGAAEKTKHTAKPTGTAKAETTETTTPEKAAKSEATAKASDNGKATDTTKASSTKAKGDVKDANDFFGQSDKALMDAVRNGTIPDSVSQDPKQMQRLQLRMNDISQMNQLITTMLTALHDMNKQVISNIRA